MKITIGYTKSDRLNNYIPMSDGFRAGADQDLVELDLDNAPTADVAKIAEMAFVATNSPYEVSKFEQLLRDRLAGYRSLSVGDTVSVNGHTVACGKVGWEELRWEELHAGDLTTRDVVIQSALIHPSWSVSEHIAFLESEHGVDVTPFNLEKLRKDVLGWMTEVAESNDVAGLHNFQLTESGQAKVAAHILRQNLRRDAGRCGFENARGRCVADADPSSPTGSCKLHEL